ncbi:SPOR domain-containing protein [Magnetospirillum molischianum]|uniref:Periplasmic protein TonB, links inner and outer membranes n=1 Tax=Magnetospirillum molischianum DSM 120 TaxID=1150626 RepID=H8FRF7_MAGML|nr:SPOR domain-containing protein [Magnetospirillum molischianum]CCG40945.1 Periplasmic protein TonB, links inner and outer membranes [Magnetospirillum molischianum DSM 120]
MVLRPSDDYDRDILDIIPERYDADADSHEARAGHRLRGIVTIVAAVVAVGAIVAVGLHFIGGRKGAGDGVPVIKAEDRPFKMRPDDRGGMQVPNQDKLVYERMESGSETDGRVERLLPPPESPKAPPRPSAVPTETLTLPQAPVANSQPIAQAIPSVAPPVQAVAPAAAPVAIAPAPTSPLPATSALAPPPPASSYQPVQTRAAPAVPAAPVAAAPAPVAKAPPPVPASKPQVITPAQVANVVPAPAPVRRTGGGDFVVQLGAVRAADLADKEWARIQKTYADLLGGLKSDIVRVELEGKGVYWRIRAGGLDEQSARQICADLTRRNQGCIVARK